jgi:hypothetical protein
MQSNPIPLDENRTTTNVRRYETLWLPLLASQAIKEATKLSQQAKTGEKQEDGTAAAASSSSTGTAAAVAAAELFPSMVPPLDVAWLWHCHRLAPRSYAKASREVLQKTAAAASPSLTSGGGGGGGGEDGHASSLTSLPRIGSLPLSLDCPSATFRGAAPLHDYDTTKPQGVEGEEGAEEESYDEATLATMALWEEAYPEEPFFLVEAVVETAAAAGGDDRAAAAAAAAAADAAGTEGGGEQWVATPFEEEEEEREKEEEEEDDTRLHHRLRRRFGVIAGFDVVESCERQSSFLWQVNLILFTSVCVFFFK